MQRTIVTEFKELKHFCRRAHHRIVYRYSQSQCRFRDEPNCFLSLTSLDKKISFILIFVVINEWVQSHSFLFMKRHNNEEQVSHFFFLQEVWRKTIRRHFQIWMKAVPFCVKLLETIWYFPASKTLNGQSRRAKGYILNLEASEIGDRWAGWIRPEGRNSLQRESLLSFPLFLFSARIATIN